MYSFHVGSEDTSIEIVDGSTTVHHLVVEKECNYLLLSFDDETYFTDEVFQ